MTAERFDLAIAPTARRQLTDKLPEAVASAAYEFIVGPLLDNPHRECEIATQVGTMEPRISPVRRPCGAKRVPGLLGEAQCVVRHAEDK